MAKLDRAFALRAEGQEFEPRKRQMQVVKAVSVSSLQNARRQLWMFRVKVYLARYMYSVECKHRGSKTRFSQIAANNNF